MQIAASDAEKRDIGGALSDALQYFDETAPLVKGINVLGPWSGVIDGLAGAIYRRAVYIAQHRVDRRTPPPAPPEAYAPPTAPEPGFAPVYAREDESEIVAPDPGRSGFIS